LQPHVFTPQTINPTDSQNTNFRTPMSK